MNDPWQASGSHRALSRALRVSLAKSMLDPGCWICRKWFLASIWHLASSFGFTTPDLPAVGNVQLGRIGMKVKSDFHTQDGIGVEP